MAKAYFAGGCFWCNEAVFQMIKGVKGIDSGYAGGKTDHPSYEEVSTGTTDHAETICVDYDPSVISYDDLLYIFFKSHDPTTLDQQGEDVGSQYRSVIFYVDQRQYQSAQKALKTAQENFEVSIVTEILPLKYFYKAEGYHQDYYKNNPGATYCKVVIDPKIQKLKKDLGNYINETN